MFKLFDAHIHWQDERLQSSFENDYKLAKGVGIQSWICAGTMPSDWEAVLNLHKKEVNILPALGFHPWFLLKDESDSQWKKTLLTQLKNEKILLGEFGLDDLIAVPWERQKEAFLFQWRLGRELNRPMILHCVKAYEDLKRIISEEGRNNPPFLLHSYSGSREQIDEFLKLGAYFSVSGNITSPTNKKAKLNAQEIPLERLLIETDAPAMNPYVNGARIEGMNTSPNLILVFKELAKIRGIAEEKLALILEHNFNTLSRQKVSSAF